MPTKDILTFAQELGQRIAMVAQRVGGKRSLGQRTGIKESTLYRYIKGENDIPAAALISIAEAGDVSLQWLAIGMDVLPEIPSARGRSTADLVLSTQLLIDIVKAVEDEMDRIGKVLERQKKGEVVALVSRLMQHEPRERLADIVAQCVQLATPDHPPC